jgi:hypothetical protein
MSRTRLFAAAVSVFVILTVSGFAQKKTAASKTKPLVLLDTSMGAIKVELYPAKAPITVKNFLDYVNSGFYNGTIVHRVDFSPQANWRNPPSRMNPKMALRISGGRLRWHATIVPTAPPHNFSLT